MTLTPLLLTARCDSMFPVTQQTMLNSTYWYQVSQACGHSTATFETFHLRGSLLQWFVSTSSML
jgi:hypothetical protein